MTIEATQPRSKAYTRNHPAVLAPFRLSAYNYGQKHEQDSAQRNAELFYLQKQIQSQTPMAIVLEDGEQIEGCIEWYDRNAIKIRGRQKTMVYKFAIKYMYKVGDAGQ